MFRPFLALLPILALCSACTATKVLMHSTESDPVALPSGEYHLDPHHWSITFDVDHLGYSRFVMRFDRADAKLDFDAANPERSHLSVTIKAASIDSNVSELDDLLRSDSLLDSAHYPEIRFTARELHRTGKNTGEMMGDLTLLGKTQPVSVMVTFNGGAANPITGDDSLGFSAHAQFDRASFGLSKWYPAVGNQINVAIQAEFIKPQVKN